MCFIGNLLRGIKQRSQIICTQKGNCRCYKCPKDTEALRLWMPPTCVAERPWSESEKKYSDVFLSNIWFYPCCIYIEPVLPSNVVFLKRKRKYCQNIMQHLAEWFNELGSC